MPQTALPFMTSVGGHVLIHHPDTAAVLPKDWTGLCVDGRDVTKHWYIGQEGGERSYNALQAQDPETAQAEVMRRRLTDDDIDRRVMMHRGG